MPPSAETGRKPVHISWITEPANAGSVPAHDPDCYLCPGVLRAHGLRNPDYDKTFVFDNDYPALLPNAAADESVDCVLVAEPESGICRMVCYTPDHSRTMAGMSPAEIRAVVDLLQRPEYAIFIDGVNCLHVCPFTTVCG